MRPSDPPEIIARPCDGVPYLCRWKLFKLFWFEFKFHVFISSDTSDVHDHPFSFLSIMLAGSYREVIDGVSTTYKAPHIHFRRAGCKHRIEIDDPCLTFLITGPRKPKKYGEHDWGFYTKQGYIPWYDYTKEKGICE